MRGITSFVNEVTLANNTKINNTRTSYIKALDNINRNNYLGTLAKRAAIFGAAVSIGQMGYYGLVKKDFDKLGSSASQVIGGVYGAAGGATLGGAITAALGGTALGSILIPTAIVLGAVAVGYIGTKIGGFVWDGTKDLREALEEKIADSLEILADPNTDWGDWNTLSGFILDESKNLIEKLQEKITDSLEILTDSDTDWGDWNTFLGWLGLNRDGDAHQYDPLALDLNGNGIETLAADGHKGAMFDHERNGIRTATGWVHSNDGLLVHDRDGDGKISDGSEIFGDNTPLKNGKTAAHGFAALAELDDNGDGKVDAADKTFSKLGVWRDLNHNGISEAGEIFALKDLHIKSLNLACKSADKDLGNGNTLAEVGSYTDEDGKEHIMGDLRLAADRFNSRYRDSIPLTDEQQQEVNLRGSGRVRDLREAAAQSPELAEVLQQYKNAATKEEQLALRDKSRSKDTRRALSQMRQNTHDRLFTKPQQRRMVSPKNNTKTA